MTMPLTDALASNVMWGIVHEAQTRPPVCVKADHFFFLLAILFSCPYLLSKRTGGLSGEKVEEIGRDGS
jgi:hypothetical protein